MYMRFYFISILIFTGSFFLSCEGQSEVEKGKTSDVSNVKTTKDNLLEDQQEETVEVLKLEYQVHVKRFISYVQSGYKKKVATCFSYPLQRDYPVSAIKSEAELIERYDELFDAALIKEIVSSNPATDWSEVGWRGIMLNQGTLWMSTDGKIVGSNYQTQKEKEIRKQLNLEDKNTLHASLKNFKQAVLVMETAKFRVRIDEMMNGTFRYASWPLEKNMSEKPDLIIQNGEVFFEGSGGNHHYDFKNNAFTYICDIIVMGEGESPPAKLVLLKNEKEIFSQDAELIKN